MKLALALALAAASCTPAHANTPPIAEPYYLGAVVCGANYCEDRYLPVYVESVNACLTLSMRILPQLLRLEGEEIYEWWCE